MLYYFGINPTDVRLFPELNHVCYSYYNYFYNKPLDKLKKNHRPGLSAFLDSGAFAYHQVLRRTGASLTEEDVRAYQRSYAAWVKGCEVQFDFQVCFDYQPTARAVMDSMRYLKRRKVLTTPVYHNGTSLTAFRKYLDAGHALICLSRASYMGSKVHTRPFLDACFNAVQRGGYKVKLHGLACTGVEMADYPWWSVDSASWRISAALGNAYFLDGGRMATKGVSHKKGNQTTDLCQTGLTGWVARCKQNIHVIQTIVDRINAKEGVPLTRKKSILVK